MNKIKGHWSRVHNDVSPHRMSAVFYSHKTLARRGVRSIKPSVQCDPSLLCPLTVLQAALIWEHAWRSPSVHGRGWLSFCKKIFPVDSKLAVHKPESPVTQGPSHCDTISASLKGVTLLMVTGNCSWRMKQCLVKYQMMSLTLRSSWETGGEKLEFAMTSVGETVTHHASSL